MILTAKAAVAGVMGWPVGHSRSPRLHGWWLDRYGIDGAYIPLAVPPAESPRRSGPSRPWACAAPT